jgi:hypothetical protein
MIGYDDDDIALVIKIERDGWVISGHLSLQKRPKRFTSATDMTLIIHYMEQTSMGHTCVGISISMTREK